jgi:hypothetical protein
VQEEGTTPSVVEGALVVWVPVTVVVGATVEVEVLEGTAAGCVVVLGVSLFCLGAHQLSQWKKVRFSRSDISFKLLLAA